MALHIGDESADSGMAKAIFVSIEETLSEPMEEALGEEKWEEIRDELIESWKRLSYALAKAIVSYLRRDPPSASMDSFC